MERLKWGQCVPPEMQHLVGTLVGVIQYGVCNCPSCVAEGKHDDSCKVHVADFEKFDPIPCDCGLREGGPWRQPEWAFVDVHCGDVDK